MGPIEYKDPFEKGISWFEHLVRVWGAAMEPFAIPSDHGTLIAEYPRAPIRELWDRMSS